METPTITASTYTSSYVDPGALVQQWMGGQAANNLQAIQQRIQNVSQTRIVKVFIADPNDNLPLDKRVLFTGEERLTDLTDQELFFEVPIQELLAKHNDVRKATVDKKQSERFGKDIFLDAARVRDLKMAVVTVAQF